MKKLLLLFALLFAESLQAATLYLSPSGSNAGPNNCQTYASPCATFSYAIGLMVAGDTLVLKDGTYTSANSGYIRISGRNGNASAWYTIKAENERQAYIQGDVNGQPLAITSSSYWSIEGIHAENGDFSGQASAAEQGSVFGITASSYINFKRNLLLKNNRYFNSHGIACDTVDHFLFEENEIYSVHRHAIRISGGNYCTFRRNYVNGRTYADIQGGYGPSNPTTYADGAFVIYPGNHNILENNIAEHVGSSFDLSASSTTIDNKFLGNISLNSQYSLWYASRNNTLTYMPRDNYAENHISIGSTAIGLYFKSAKNSIVKNATVINGTGTQGVIASVGSSPGTGDGNPSVYLTNVLSAGNTGYGFNISGQTGGWTVNYPDSYGNTTAFTPAASDPNITNELTSDPALGSCYCWIPASSPMKGAGLNNADVGANVLFEYVNGVLTSTPLWNTSTNDFVGCGAIVTGINDVAGSSCNDVDVRLHIGTANGCAFPSGYGGTSGAGGNWVSIDNFDSYSLDADLNTLNGGSGWAAAWTQAVGTLLIKVAPAGGQGGNAVSNYSAQGSDFDYYRTFSDLSAGLAQLSFYITANPTNALKINLQHGTDIVCQVFVDTDGYFKILGGASRVSVDPYTLNAWNAISIEFDDTNQPDLFRARLNSGNWSQWYTVASTTYAHVDHFRIYSDQGNGMGVPIWIDNIGEAYSGSVVSTIAIIDSALATQGLHISTVKPLAWSSTEVTGNIDIWISRDNQLTWQLIARGVPNTGTYNWTVAPPASTHCRIKVSSSSHPEVYAISQEFRVFGKHLR